MIYPIDKTNIDILRFLHFLAIAWLVRMLVPIDAPVPEMARSGSHFADAVSILAYILHRYLPGPDRLR